MRKILFAILILSASLFSCEDEERRDLQKQVLIESFVYYGQSKNQLEIRLFSPLSASGVSPYLNPDRVLLTNLTKGTTVFPAFDTTGIYIIETENINLEEDETFQLIINYGAETILAQSKVPLKPTGLEFDVDELKLNYIVDAVPNTITLGWNLDNENYYMVKIDTAEFEPDSIDSSRFSNDPGNPFESRLGVPITTNEIEISYPDVKYFGWHRAIVFHISNDYYELYNNPVQGSYNKVNQSVANGLGIFTSFNSDTIRFNVIQ